MRAAAARTIEVRQAHSAKREYGQGIVPNQVCEILPTQSNRARMTESCLDWSQQYEVEPQVARLFQFRDIVARGAAPFHIGA